MDIIVKKDILDELQSKGFCRSPEEAEQFLDIVIQEIGNLLQNHQVQIRDFGTFTPQGEEKSLVAMESKIEEICPQTSLEEERFRNAFFDLFHFIKDCLLKGLEIQIMDFITLRLEERKAKIVKDPRSDRKIIIPTKKILHFELENSLREKVGDIQFQPAPTFQKQIDNLRTASVLLVVPNRDFFVKTLEYHFEKIGWKTHTALSVEEAENYINSGNTFLVILDNKVENYQALCEVIKCRRHERLIPLVMMYASKKEMEKPKEFRICGDERIAQPFEIKHLLTTADNVLRKTSEEEAIFEQDLQMKFPTTDKNVEKANAIAQKLFDLAALSEDEKIGMVTAFREAVGNAAQHGNKYRRDKLLGIHYVLDKEKITIAVENSGSGFNWQQYVDIGQSGDAIGRARQRYKEGRMGGLGIMLMLKCVDKLEYNDSGTVTTLTKYLK